MPGADFGFALCMPACNSSIVKEGSKLGLLAHGIAGEGELGKKHDGGQIEGMRFKMFS